MKKLTIILACMLSLTLVAAACGDDDDSEDATDAEGSESSGEDATGAEGSDPDAVSHTEMSPEELEIWQSDLAAVGCYGGAVDGANGPLTEAAVTAYQTAKGLTADGLLGPVTESALQESVAAGETVCTTSAQNEDTAESDAGAATAMISSSNYGPVTFALGTCSLNADVSNLSIAGQAESLTLNADASGGSGTLSIDGGTEQDGITLNGTIEAVDIDADRTFIATGEFGEPNNVGEFFTVTGFCPE